MKMPNFLQKKTIAFKVLYRHQRTLRQTRDASRQTYEPNWKGHRTICTKSRIITVLLPNNLGYPHLAESRYLEP